MPAGYRGADERSQETPAYCPKSSKTYDIPRGSGVLFSELGASQGAEASPEDGSHDGGRPWLAPGRALRIQRSGKKSLRCMVALADEGAAVLTGAVTRAGLETPRVTGSLSPILPR